METNNGTYTETWGEHTQNQSVTSSAGDQQPGSNCSKHGNIQVGVDCPNWSRGDQNRFRYAGGILTQMIKQASDHLDEMTKFVDLFEQKREEALEALEHLQSLQHLQDQQSEND